MRSIGLLCGAPADASTAAAAADRLDAVDLVVRSRLDVEREGRAAVLDALGGTDAAIVDRHGAEAGFPDDDRALADLGDRTRVIDLGGPASTVPPSLVDGIGRYFEAGGPINVANAVRVLAADCGASVAADDPRPLPDVGAAHPDHPGASRATVREQCDPDRPTVGIWLYPSQWARADTDHIDRLVRAIEGRGVDALPVFADPVADGVDARQVAREWAAETAVDAVVTTYMYALAMDERGGSAGGVADRGPPGALEALDVPVIQALTATRPRAAYADDDRGLRGHELALGVALPELDGAVITHPISGREPVQPETIAGTAARHRPIDERCDHVAALACRWARLARRPPAERRVAVVLHNYPPSADGIGTAFGLDTPASLDRLLDTLADRGHEIGDPPDGEAIVQSLAADWTRSREWGDPDRLRADAAGVIDPATYRAWFDALDADLRAAIRDEWGDLPDAPIAVPGQRFGNVLVTIQPPRGFAADPESIYHDATLYPPHEYVATYRWLDRGFGADAVVHLGTHGSLEWLPGKTVGLDAASAPDGLIDSVPNVYPYVLNNPGEAAQATRRSYAQVIGHLPPPMDTAGTHGDLSALADLAARARREPTDQRIATLRERARSAGLGPELDCSLDAPDDRLVAAVHDYCRDVATTRIRMGLHTLGEAPADDRLVGTLLALVRRENPAGSLHAAVADRIGSDPDTPRVEAVCRALVASLAAADFDPDAAGPLARAVAGAPADEAAIRSVLEAICTDVVGRLRAADCEADRVADALGGEYVPPGPGGAPTRGQHEVLPSGRTLYTVDPRRLPDRSAWRVGQQIASDLLATHREREGAYPEEVGAIVWGTPTIRSRGETVAVILALLGVEPCYDDAGRIDDLRVLPIEALDRPRIDVTVRVSGLFRDALPQVGGLIQSAVAAVADRDESPDRNYVRKHVIEECQMDGTTASETDAADATTTSPDDAPASADDAGLARAGTVAPTRPIDSEHSGDGPRRVFTTEPGGYGAGTNKAVSTGAWSDRSDLADVFATWSGHAIDADGDVSPAGDAVERRLASIEATIKCEDTVEQDPFDSGDWYAFHGGLQAAVADRRGEAPAAYVGDATGTAPTVTTNDRYVRQHMRARILNPDWLDSMAEHGYKGGGDLATAVETTLGWSATTGAIGDHLWRTLAERTALDDERREWLLADNPWALASIGETLLDAIDRGLWDADADVIERIEAARLAAEGAMEGRA
ncbi:MAG: cobaltochelatase subunit CobN [Halococcoides sp.]